MLARRKRKEFSTEGMERLVEVLKEFTPSDIKEIEESDRQYRALKELYLALKDRELFFKLVLLNSLLSYQLQMKGEDYWEKFSSFFKENPLEEFEKFLSLYNKRFLPSKLKRYKRALKCVNLLFERYSLEELGKELPLLVKSLSECMGQKRDAKTIVFAAKMFTYAYRIVFNTYPKGLWEVEIPLDSRLKKILPSLKKWREVSEKVGIPPILLDALIWVPMGKNPIPENLKGKVSLLKKVLNTFL